MTTGLGHWSFVIGHYPLWSSARREPVLRWPQGIATAGGRPMSRIAAVVALALALASPAFAAPREKEPSPEALAVGDQFARQLGAVVQMVAREYVRPVE